MSKMGLLFRMTSTTTATATATAMIIQKVKFTKSDRTAKSNNTLQLKFFF